MEFARFLGLPPVKRGYNTTDIADAVYQLMLEARVDLVLVDELHNLNLATVAGEDMSDHLKYFTEHLPATPTETVDPRAAAELGSSPRSPRSPTALPLGRLRTVLPPQRHRRQAQCRHLGRPLSDRSSTLRSALNATRRPTSGPGCPRGRRRPHPTRALPCTSAACCGNGSPGPVRRDGNAMLMR